MLAPVGGLLDGGALIRASAVAFSIAAAARQEFCANVRSAIR